MKELLDLLLQQQAGYLLVFVHNRHAALDTRFGGNDGWSQVGTSHLLRGGALRGEFGVPRAGKATAVHHIRSKDLVLPRPFLARQFVIDFDAVAVRVAKVYAQ